jgi:ketosteroid isomerase-like protein
MFGAWMAGEREVPEDLIDPEVEVVSPLTEVRGRPYRGYDDARQWLLDIDEQFERWEYEIDEMREVGDAVLALGRVHLTGRGSGISLDQEGAWLVDFAADGRVNRLRVFTDRSAALEAAGLPI